jgi:hypothetical protein
MHFRGLRMATDAPLKSGPMTTPATYPDPDAYRRLVARTRVWVAQRGQVAPEVTDGPARVAPPRLRVVLPGPGGDWWAHDVSTVAADWDRATEALGRTRAATPDQMPHWWRARAAWHAMRRTGRTTLTWARFWSSKDGALEVSSLDDPTPGQWGHLADYVRDVAGRDQAAEAAAAVRAALGLDADEDEDPAPARDAVHDHTDWRAPPPLLDVLTTCVLTAAPPPAGAPDATHARAHPTV